MEYLNKTSYCSSLGTAALLINSRMMFVWVRRRGFTGNTMLRSSLYNPVPLVSLSRMTMFYMYLFIHFKRKQISFPLQLKKYKGQKQDLRSTNKKSKIFLSSWGPLPHQATSTVTQSDSKYSWQCYTTSEHQWHDRYSRGLVSWKDL